MNTALNGLAMFIFIIVFSLKRAKEIGRKAKLSVTRKDQRVW